MGGRVVKSQTLDPLDRGDVVRSVRTTTTGASETEFRVNEFDMLSLEALPDDVLENVLSFLPGKLLLAYKKVCVRWRDIIDRQSLWRTKCERRDTLSENWHQCLCRLPEPINYQQLYFTRPYTRNLIKNPRATEGFLHWDIKHAGGDGFAYEKDHPGSNAVNEYVSVKGEIFCWATSYRLCQKSQLVDLVREGCSEAVLDHIKPPILISEWYSVRWDCGGRYSLNVQLLAADHTVIDTFNFEIDVPERQIWQQVTHTFEDYKTGVRFVRFTHGGVDSSFWAGYYGPKFTLSTVRFLPPRLASKDD